MSQQYRNYNDFSLGAIHKNDDNQTASSEGWLNESFGNTPINADNLNAMLQMLIDIRNVIGKTTDFATNVNGENITQPNPESSNSVATYIKAVADAIIGSSDDSLYLNEKLTLNSIKNYLEFIDCGTATEVIDNGGTN